MSLSVSLRPFSPSLCLSPRMGPLFIPFCWPTDEFLSLNPETASANGLAFDRAHCRTHLYEPSTVLPQTRWLLLVRPVLSHVSHSAGVSPLWLL